jgi:hypothetical protein
MLGDQEQVGPDDVERSWTVLTEESRRDVMWSVRPPTDLPAAVVAGSWAVILLTLAGQMDAVLVVGLATALYWSLWRLTRGSSRAGSPRPDRRPPRRGAP